MQRSSGPRAARLACLAGVVATAIVVMFACAETKVAAEGGDCFAATDCDVGLICAVGKDGRRACTKDLTDTTKVPNQSSSSGGTDARSDAVPQGDAQVGVDAPIVVQDTGVDAPVTVADTGPDVIDGGAD